MNTEIFIKLLRSYFDERNARMIDRFSFEKQFLKSGDVIDLSSNIMSLYAVVKMELMESSDIIVEIAFDVVKSEYLISNYAQIRKACSSAYMERAVEIERIFLQNLHHLEKESQNTERMNPYMPVADFEFLQLIEINGKVSESYQWYIIQHNHNLIPRKREIVS